MVRMIVRHVRVCATFLAMLVFVSAAARAADAPPAMIVPGQFNVSQTGAATYTIPIAVPPGSAGLVPALSLDYSSQGGDGIVGVGWTLSGLPSISRCPRTLAQDSVHGGVNYDSNDRFCMDGQRLVAISGTYGANGTEYRTEIDGFSRIISYGTAGSGPSYFKVWTKAGQIMEFGNSTDSKILAVGTSTARAWAVNKISDTKSNYLTVTYTNDTTNGQAYPTEIDYTGNVSASVSPYNSVRFTYTTRSDITPTYQAGSLQQTTVVLTDVKTYQGSSVVYDYQLAYRSGTSTLRSRLTSVTLCDGASHCLAPATFGWQGGSGLPTMTATSISIAQGTAAQIPTIGLAPADYNGDGLTDLYFFYSTSFCGMYLSDESNTLNSASWNATYTFWEKEGSIYTQDAYDGAMCAMFHMKRLMDINGDGIPDAEFNVTLRPPGTSLFHFMANNGSNYFSELSYPVLGSSTTSAFLDGDFDGDGRFDALVQGTSGSTSYAYIGDGSGGFTADGGHSGVDLAYTDFVGDFDGDGCSDVLTQGTSSAIKYFCNPATASASISHWTTAGTRIVLGDFNGDGKTDVLVTYPSSAGTLYLSTGTGLTATSFSVPTDWGKYEIVVGDWNGDGKADLALIAGGGTGMYTHGTNHQIWLSTGSGFSSQTTISNSSSSDTFENAVVADFNNDGASDFWLQRPSGDAIYTFAYAPELMTSVSNGIGSTITITYDRLNQNGSFYVKGTGATYPTQDLDGPLYTVKQVSGSNGVGGSYTSTYAYAGIKNDVQGRGFLGFSTVTVTDSQTSVVQTTNYSTTFPYIGLVTSQTRTHSGTTLNSVTNTLENVALGSGRYFVGMHQAIASGHDLNGASLPTTTATYTYDCDSTTSCYGNATTIAVSVSDGSSKTTTNTYSNDTTNWFLGRLTATSVESVVGSSDITRSSSFAYDSSTGLLTQEIVEPSNCEYKLQTDYTYDSFGHRTATQVSGAGCSSDSYRTAISTRTSYAYFDSAGEFMTSTSNPLSQSESWTYNAAFGLPASHTGPNSLSMSWSYDYFGRPTLETRPDGTKTSITYAYCSGVNGGSASCPTNGAYLKQTEPLASDGTTQIGPIATVYYDALSRAIAQDMQGFDGSTIRTATIYDANGRIYETSRPYFVSGGTAKWTVNTYDDLGRVTRTDFPNSSYITFSYNGLTTSATNDHSQTTSTTLNAQGLKASVTDAASHTTSYIYDAEGDLLTVTDPASNVITNAYDLRGHKTISYDPDMGQWTYISDVLGQLKSQTDAKSQTTTLSYDVLGRVTERSESGLVSNWVYDGATYGVGKLQKTCTSSSSNPTCASATTTKTFTYDSTGRPSTTTINVDSANYTYTTTYNSTNGAVDTVTYPSSLVVKNIYNSDGYLCRITDNGSSHTCTDSLDIHVLWTGSSRDAELHLTSQTAGDGAFSTTQTFDANTGLLTNVRAGASDSVAAFDYSYDTIGNLLYRSDNHVGVYEKFCYDSLNRLTTSATASTTPTACSSTGSGITAKTIGYDQLGNITSKSDVGTYSYPSSGGGTGTHPHAVSSITGTVNGVTNPSYTYDSNGSMTAGAGRSITYTAFNMADTITQGSSTFAFNYDSDHARIKQCDGSSCATSTTYYLNDPASGAMAEKFVSGGTTTWHDYLKVDGKIIAERFAVVGGSTSWVYFVLDHLGSIAVVTDSAGSVSERDSYDAFGRRRNNNGTDNTSCSITSTTSRGFTGHEEIDSACLVNANARIYDPTIGRFMSADPTIDTPDNLQVYNRYSYVGNNPLSFTDPSGLCFLGCFWKQSWFTALLDVAIFFIAPELEGLSLSALISSAANFSLQAIGILALNGGLAGGLSTAVAGGNILKGAGFGALGAALSFGAGGYLGNVLGGTVVSRFIAQGAVGGLMSVIEGGKFGSGFLAAGVGSLAGQFSGGQFDVAKMLASAAIGGAASVLGGGKFENGAITAAFAYAATSLAQPNRMELRADTINGPEIPGDQRRSYIDGAIATFYAQGGHTGLGWFENDYDTYVVTNAAYTSDVHYFSSLADANQFMSAEMKLGNVYEWVSGETSLNIAHIYASAAYPLNNAYGDPVIGKLYALFVVWHENGHQFGGYLGFGGGGGGGCGMNEQCANSWAFGHYKLPTSH